MRDYRFESLLYESIDEGKNLGVLKDRQAGCSRGVLFVLFQHWRHGNDKNFLVMKRKEDSCCNSINPLSSLSILLGFAKEMSDASYIYHKKSRTLENLENGNLIHFGTPGYDDWHGCRYSAVFLDDFMSYHEPSSQSTMKCLRDTTKCLIIALDAECVGPSLLSFLIGCDAIIRLKELV